jgi:hypothetical protein
MALHDPTTTDLFMQSGGEEQTLSLSSSASSAKIYADTLSLWAENLPWVFLLVAVVPLGIGLGLY